MSQNSSQNPNNNCPVATDGNVFRHYWIELGTLMLMTVLLTMSFTAGSPLPTGQRTPLKRSDPYHLGQPDSIWLRYGWTDSATHQSWDVQVRGDGQWQMALPKLATPSADHRAGDKGTKSGRLTPKALENLLHRAAREEALEWRQERLRGDQNTPAPSLAQLHISLNLPDKNGAYELVWHGKTDNYNSEQRRFLRLWAELLTEIPSPRNEKAIDYLQ